MALGSTLSCEVIDSANLYLRGLIGSDFLREKRNKIANNISKTMKLDGFRKGKVPLSVVNSRFSDKIEKDAEQEALNCVIENTMKENGIELNMVLGGPVIKKYDKNDNGIDIEVQICTFPTIVFDNYADYIPDFNLESITCDCVDNRLSEIARANGPLIEADRPLNTGDIANIDFEGFINGKAFDNGKSENFDLEIGSKRFINGFEEQLIGMVNGEKRDINVRFPDNYNVKDLAGKEAIFKVKLNKVQERGAVSIDDNFAKIMLPGDENATLDKLKDNVRIQLQNESKNKLFSELKQPLIDGLLNGVSFDLPKNIIEQELDMVFRNKLGTLNKDDLKVLQEDKFKAEEVRESLREEAIKSVKLTLLVDFLAKKLSISVSDDEVYQTLYYEALMLNKDPKELFDFYVQNNMIPTLKITLLEGKVLNNLLESKLNV